MPEKPRLRRALATAEALVRKDEKKHTLGVCFGDIHYLSDG